MTLLWLAAAALSVLTLALLVAPLLSRRTASPPSRRDLDLRIYRQQLAEVEHDVERGLLAPSEAEAARTEVKRRILAASGEGGGGTAVTAGAAAKPETAARHRFVAAVCALTIPLAATGLYLIVGAPGEADRPLAARPTGPSGMAAGIQGQGEALSMDQAVAQLAQRMESRPDDLDGWALLGRAYLGMGRYADASAALGRAHALSPERPEIAAAFGEAQVATAEGQVGDEAKAAFAQALEREPREPRARFYLGLAKAQQGDVKGALQDWVDLVAISPADAPWLASVREQIAKAAAELGVDIASVRASPQAVALGAIEGGAAPAAPGPSAADVKAAEQMSEGDRGQMIRSMVERLAAKLKDDPGDRQGWLRLARAYQVLGEPEKAAEAQARGDALDKR